VLDVDPDSNPHFDESIGINKTKLLRPKRMNFLFVEEGKWSKDAESIKLKVSFCYLPFCLFLSNCLICAFAIIISPHAE
jgi:hypothetical protein